MIGNLERVTICFCKSEIKHKTFDKIIQKRILRSNLNYLKYFRKIRQKIGRVANQIPAGIRRRYDVEIWLKIGRQRRQRDINVILTSFCERWFNISIQTSKQRRYNVRRFDLKFC